MRAWTVALKDSGPKGTARFAVGGVLAAALGVGCAAPQPQEWSDMFPERSHFTRLDIDGDGYLSPGEIDPQQPLLRDFASWDRNGDQRIDYREFTAYMAAVMT